MSRWVGGSKASKRGRERLQGGYNPYKESGPLGGCAIAGKRKKRGGPTREKCLSKCVSPLPPLYCASRGPYYLPCSPNHPAGGKKAKGEKGKILLADKRPPQKKARRRRPFSPLAAHDIWAFVGKAEGKTRGLLAAVGVGEEASVVS